MNELQSHLCEVLALGLRECASLAEETPPQVALIDELAETLEAVPRSVYDQRRLRLRDLERLLRRHQRRHAGCPHDYEALLVALRAPSWAPWARDRVRPSALAGDTRLDEAQLSLLSVERSLLFALRAAAWEKEPGLLRDLAALARRVPRVQDTHELEAVARLSGPSGPWASTGCPHWKVFQPLTIPADEMVRKYLG